MVCAGETITRLETVRSAKHLFPARVYSTLSLKRSDYYTLLKGNQKNIRFDQLCHAAEKFGFTLRGGKGSHRIFVRVGIPEMLNFQNVDGKAKPYQVKQLCSIIEKYSLQTEGEDV